MSDQNTKVAELIETGVDPADALRGTATLILGSGTPEGVVASPVGGIYLRRDGGAGTTLYIKESGTGLTGWVGK